MQLVEFSNRITSYCHDNFGPHGIIYLTAVMEILGIQLNAASVVNLIMAIGIVAEFCVHIVHAFTESLENRNQRAKTALCTIGASIFSGITLTKLVGVIVLCFATSEIFVVCYFPLYLALVIIGHCEYLAQFEIQTYKSAMLH
ncbi:hypothetical protein V8G54_006568 [Vigna mungo]|uniref:SSD domain-containing protein n=1 Tax=Vigna mungo TaxID=3915 RepID=A0AAQ3S840_VIGMU